MASPPPHGKFVRLFCKKSAAGEVSFESLDPEEDSEYFKAGEEYSGALTIVPRPPDKQKP
jgi:hypothetical protein